MGRFIPPAADVDEVNIRSSENTTLFLVSCFQYIYAGIILSMGPPFRQSMAHNSKLTYHDGWYSFAEQNTVPFIVTIVATFLISAYMLFDPGKGLRDFMDLTLIPVGFKFFTLGMAVEGFLVGWIAEKYVFLWTARLLGRIHDRIWPQRRKVRKLYKRLLEDMRI